MKVLIISHAHPMESTGGAELAAYNLFEALSLNERCESVTFLAGSSNRQSQAGSIHLLSRNEYLWAYNDMDWFRLTSGTPDALVTNFRSFLVRMAPSIIYVHHYAHLGLEIFREAKTSLPSCKVILTLHEYLAICNRNGQMIKNNSRKLCYQESIQECQACFPEKTREDFWLRKHFIQRSFEHVDHFISPSQFLLERYIAWGIPREFTSVIENGQKYYGSQARVSTEDLASQNHLRSIYKRFAYFGQATEYKGIEVFLRAIHALSPELRRSMLFEVHCANIDQQGDWFKDLLHELRTPLVREGVLRWVGPYDHNDLAGRMSQIGWVVVPSTWWENSPMVIQEALTNHRPVICSNIGGMAEKVRNGVDGIHFAVNNFVDLAERMIYAASNIDVWLKYVKNIRPTQSLKRYGDDYLSAVGRC